ncbi:hypothetical protein ARMGADRAFT_1116287 [Armillaria gallica]|uniref:Uncharacterized protein n=1 Tax=Armillaria gallica TaxID=47427 RepID=A0A2H3DYF4_ARMGA|nr:hypothetical protein ARMGADRAFT_1116287 [Armillaria gallica]
MRFPNHFYDGFQSIELPEDYVSDREYAKAVTGLIAIYGWREYSIPDLVPVEEDSDSQQAPIDRSQLVFVNIEVVPSGPARMMPGRVDAPHLPLLLRARLSITRIFLRACQGRLSSTGACCRKSIIYDDLVPRLTRTISCFADLQKIYLPDRAAIRVYNLLVQLPNYIGFRTLFPLAEYISLEVKWIGGLRFTDDTEIHGFPFHLRRRRNLSKSAQEIVRMDTYVCITEPEPSSTLYRKSWSSTSFLALNDYCYPSMQLVYWELPYDVDAKGGLLQFRQTVCLQQAKGDLEGVNQYLWMAAQRERGIFKRLSKLFYYWKYYRLYM